MHGGRRLGLRLRLRGAQTSAPGRTALALRLRVLLTTAGTWITFALAPSLAHADKLVTITIPARRGEVASKWLSYSGPPRANVLLDDRYDPHRRYPLLVLLNGSQTDYAWYARWGLNKQFDGLNAIVVMLEGGSSCYADWWNGGERGNPAWESYELDEALPTILPRFRILPQRRYHAIAPISMGGLGAAYLGGRLPGFFGSVASLWGFVDPQYFAQVTDPAMGWTAEAPLEGDYNLYALYGAPCGFYATGHKSDRAGAQPRADARVREHWYGESQQR